MDPRVLRNLRGQSAGHGYAAARFTQHERRKVIEGAAKTGTPENDICTNNGAVGPADAVFEDLAEHRQTVQRSEEHTSELQSRQYLVCRLLLEKKKKIRPIRTSLHSASHASIYT